MELKKIRKNKYILPAAAFALPLLICLIIFAIKGVWPFGSRCILHMDMYHQYCPFFIELQNKLKSGDSLMYSWDIGLGSDFFAVYVYYLSSPLNWLLLVCPQSHVIEFMTLMIVLKIAGSGLSFFWYLKEHFCLKTAGGYKTSAFAAAVFSTGYALSGFVAAYSWDIMWMDCVALAPLIILGLERLVRENKVKLYYITLALSVLCNYYLSIMICIFLVLYFLILFIEQKKGRWMAAVRFAVYSLLAGGTGMILIIPELKILSYSGSSGLDFPETVEWYFNILAELTRTSATAAVYEGNDHWPNLYVGVFCLLFVGLYAANRMVSWKKKLPRLALVVFFLLSFANNVLDFIWHGFHFPDSLPGRESFLFAFVMLVLGFEAWVRRAGNKPIDAIVTMAAGAALLLAGAYYGDSAVTDNQAVITTAALLVGYGSAYLLYQMEEAEKKKFMAIVMGTLAICELGINMYASGLSTTSRTTYVSKEADYQVLLEAAQQDAMEQAGAESADQVFYRVEDTERLCKNDDAHYTYSSATQFSSLMNINVSHFYQKYYMEGGKNFYCYNGATPILSAMLDVQYYLSDSPYDENELHTLVAESDGLYLYRNNYTLPLGYMMNENTVSQVESIDGSKLDAVNELSESLGADSDMLSDTFAEISVNPGETIINIPEDGYYYASSLECDPDTLTFVYDNGKELTYSKTTHTYLFDLGSCNAGEQITVTNSGDDEVTFRVYRLNMEAVQQAFDTLSESVMKIDFINSTEIRGSVQADRAGRLILSVPAEEGWTLYVDGEKADIVSFADTFISIPLSQGEHEISLYYETPGLKIGAVITAACLICFLILICIRHSLSQLEKTPTSIGGEL